MEMLTFGKLNDGRTAGLYVLRNSSGMSAALTDYGATLVSLAVPDRNGDIRDVVFGHDDAWGYEEGQGYIGATVGRFANRIGGASFTLNGKEHELTANDGPNALHSGRDSYSNRLWSVRIPFSEVSSRDIMASSAPESISDGVSQLARSNIANKRVVFCLDSPDGDQGFPGNLHIEVTYTLTDEGELHIDYMARSDADTPFNPTNHSYFNLNGHADGSILEHIVQIDASEYTPSDEGLLPTGEIKSVAGTPMDFRIPKMIGQDIDADYADLKNGGGYDHNYVIARKKGEYREAASLYSRESGIRMEVLTDMPGLQMYTGNFMKGETGKDGVIYDLRSAVCFETQYWPDSVNREDFPDCILKAGEEFRSRTTYRFSK